MLYNEWITVIDRLTKSEATAYKIVQHFITSTAGWLRSFPFVLGNILRVLVAGRVWIFLLNEYILGM